MNSRQARISRVARALQATGVAYESRQLADNTATAALAAVALGCDTAQIAKTIIFRVDTCGYEHSQPVKPAIAAVLCGDDRVNTAKLTQLSGARLQKANAQFVSEYCGFEIGGVAPLGFVQPVTVLLENRLQRFDRVWAAAGSAYTVLGIAPADLQQASGGQFADFAECVTNTPAAKNQ